ncbi:MULTISPECIES: transcriptional regulator domain-containing protein [Gammaproteobacteria]|uniref:transcriptional regulator domain-containing protein n=1 Tax=Gammaproteobacteria TaxID=1236 RepID=UPI001C72049A
MGVTLCCISTDLTGDIRPRRIPAAGFAWEHLRRNDECRHDFQATVQAGGLRTDRDLQAINRPAQCR